MTNDLLDRSDLDGHIKPNRVLCFTKAVIYNKNELDRPNSFDGKIWKSSAKMNGQRGQDRKWKDREGRTLHSSQHSHTEVQCEMLMLK